MKVQCLGGARTVTGSCYMLDTEQHKILIDCGMFQGSSELFEWNEQDFIFNPKEIAAVVLTHAHIDHSGLLPKLHKAGFTGRIIATHSTADLCSIMLPDSGHIQEAEAEWYNRKRRRRGRSQIKPLYTEEDARSMLHQFRGIPYDEIVDVVPGVKVRCAMPGTFSVLPLWRCGPSPRMGKHASLSFQGILATSTRPLLKIRPLLRKRTTFLLNQRMGIGRMECGVTGLRCSEILCVRFRNREEISSFLLFRSAARRKLFTNCQSCFIREKLPRCRYSLTARWPLRRHVFFAAISKYSMKKARHICVRDWTPFRFPACSL